MSTTPTGNRHKVTVEFELSDLAMVADAFMIARNTAMMCGNAKAQERLEQLRRMIDEMVPKEARIFNRYCWSEIGMALRTAKQWRVCIVKSNWRRRWETTGYLGVEVDGRGWHSKEIGYSMQSAAFTAVGAVLDGLAALDAERLPDATLEEKDWGEGRGRPTVQNGATPDEDGPESVGAAYEAEEEEEPTP